MRTCALITMVGIATAMATSTTKGDVVSVSASGAFLRTNSDPAPNSTIINLSTLSTPVVPGHIIHLQRVGEYAGGPFPSFPDANTSMIAVFSSSNSILTSSNLNRVPGAIAAGTSYFSEATFFGSLATDIPQDFIIDSGNGAIPGAPVVTSVDITVPVGAQFLFVSSYDSHYSTNNDPNGNYAVSITLVPEPGSLLLLGLGCATLLMRGSRRRS